MRKPIDPEGQRTLIWMEARENRRQLSMTAEETAAELHVCTSTVDRARRVLADPKLAKEVMAGVTSLHVADAILSGRGQVEREQKRAERKEAKKHEENPHEVKQFLDAMRQFSKAIEDAEGAAKFGKFGAEAMWFSVRRMTAIRDSLDKLQAMLEVRNG